MKCKKVTCPNEVTMPQMVYCSKKCAPYGELSAKSDEGRKSTSSENPIDLSISRAHGGPFQAASTFEVRTRFEKSAEIEGEKKEAEPSHGVSEVKSTEIDVSKNESLSSDQIEHTKERDSVTGTSEIESESGKRSKSEEQKEILPSVSMPLSIVAEQDRPISTIYIKQSIRQLHSLMKSVAPTRASENSDDLLRLDPARVYAACECAKQITSLMRLQLDIVKESRKA